MQNSFLNNKRIFLRYVCILFCVLLLPSIFGYMVSEFSLRTSLEEIKEKNYQSLTHIQRSFDSDLSEIKQLAVEIASGESLAAYSDAPVGTYSSYDIINANLFPYGTDSREYVQEVFIYNKKNNIIINSRSFVYTVDQYCDQVLNIYGEDRLNFIGMLNTPSFNTLHPAYNIELYNSVVQAPYMFHTQSYPFMGAYEGNVIVMLNADKMLSSFAEKFEYDNSAFYIIDNNGTIILSAGNKNYISKEFVNADDGFGADRIGGSKVIYSVRNSSTGKYKYVFIEETYGLHSSIARMRFVLPLYVVFVLLLASFFLRRITDKKSSGEPDADHAYTDTRRDRIEFIQAAIRDIINEKVLVSISADSSTATPANAVATALHSPDGHADTEDMLIFDNNYFCVVYFALSKVPAEDVSVIKYAISNISAELFASASRIYSDDSEEGALAVIINPDSDSDSTKAFILSQLTFIRNFFSDNFHADIVIGAGDILEGRGSISTSYSRAKGTAEYCTLTDSDEIIFYSDIKATDYKYSYSLELEDKLQSAVINGDVDQVHLIIDRVISSNNLISLDMSRCLFFDLTATALKIISNKSISLSEVFGGATSPYGTLMDCTTHSEMADAVHDMFGKICDQITESQDVKKDRLKVAITDYVKENYNNPNMSLSMVADAFSMNYTYMSHFFKDFIGANFIDYISDLRVKKASELLRTTNMSVNEIASEVGYANATVLIKIFKKATNTTPGMYRKNSRD